VAAADPFNLRRFVEAQASPVYERALGELRAAQKRTHWMWFIFPQHVDLGRSDTAKYYGLTGIDEALAYVDHPLLGPRLVECCIAVRQQLVSGSSAEALLGPVDALKLKSSMQIFAETDGHACFREVLDLL